MILGLCTTLMWDRIRSRVLCPSLVPAFTKGQGMFRKSQETGNTNGEGTQEIYIWNKIEMAWHLFIGKTTTTWWPHRDVQDFNRKRTYRFQQILRTVRNYKWTTRSLSVRHCFFSSIVINSWNRLPQDVVEATSVNMFKNRLDKHWKDMGVYSWLLCSSSSPSTSTLTL